MKLAFHRRRSFRAGCSAVGLGLAALLIDGCVSKTSPSSRTVVQTTSQGVISSAGSPGGPVVAQFVSVQDYKGWKNSYLLSNGQVWAAVVPAVGRVMQFGFVNDPGVFWENPDRLGQPQTANPWSVTGSFGGDKTWPAPQSEWNWPPPDVFDREPVSGRVEGNSVVLTSGVSPRYGIRTERRVSLEPSTPVMRIVTTYEKVQGEPVDVSVWVITQAKNPQQMFLPIPAGSKFPDGFSKQWGVPTNFLSRAGQRIRLVRDPRESHKIGNDASSVIWQDARQSLTIESPRISGAVYPDDGCSMEIYTNGGAVDYVELETLGPRQRLTTGDRLSATNVYRLNRR